MGRRLSLVLLLAAAVLAGPGQARAAIPLTPCGTTQRLECGQVQVPLDRSGRTPGSISLHVEVLPADGTARGVLFLVAGGPGQGSAQTFNLGSKGNAEFMQAMLPGYTLVAFDNRGTGASGLLNCPALQSTFIATAEQQAVLARDCAAIIGPQREFYATRDHVEDTDAVRSALGLDKIAILGVSYGTKLALAYALGHPGNVERLLLDSVVPPTLPDPFDRNVLHEMPATLTNFCAGNRCRAATPNFSRDVVALANRIEAHPLQGTIIAPNGKLKTVRMNGEQLIYMMVDADLSPGLAAEAPAAVHAARAGFVRPLLRLFDFEDRTSKYSAEDLSFGLNAATNCADGRFPWAPNTPPSQRRPIIDATLAGLPAGALGPFGSWAARIGTAYFCEQWPSPAGNTPLGPGPFPNVPVLAVNGGFDMRTPTVNALAVVDQFPQGRLLVVPGVGHSVLTADFSYCSQRAVRAWILGTLLAPSRAMCPRVAPLVTILGAFPRRAPQRSAQATLATASKAVREAEATWFQLLFSSTSFTPRGIYGGKLVGMKNGGGFSLSRYSIAPGVFVSGKISLVSVGPPSFFKGTVRVSGTVAVAGTLKFSKNTVSGTLGGRRVKARY